MSIESAMPSNYLILCGPLLLLPSVFPSMRGFFNESVLPIKWPKYWSFSFSISPSNEYSGLISFGMDWFDLLAAPRETLKSLLQHHSSKASVLQRSAFFMVQLSHPHMTTGKTKALTIWTFGLLGLVNCGKVVVLARGGELIEDKGHFNKVCLHRPYSVPALSLVIIVVFFLLLQERGGGHPHKGKFMTCFAGGGGPSVLSVLATA